MSAPALQRVAVRMLFDERFLEHVYADVRAATVGCDLTDTERSWLTAPDRRAWRVDPLRRSRALAALVEEFAVSVACFVRSGPSRAEKLDAFFSCAEFHAGMQAGASLAAVFAGWFSARLPDPGPDLLRLESALARGRRARETGAPAARAGSLRLAPGVEVLELAAGSVEFWSAALAALRQGEVVARAVDPGLPIPFPPTGPGREGVLVDGRGHEPRLEFLSVELAAVLAGAVEPVQMEEFCRRAAAHGADASDCRSIVDSFAADGILQTIPAQT